MRTQYASLPHYIPILFGRPLKASKIHSERYHYKYNIFYVDPSV